MVANTWNEERVAGATVGVEPATEPMTASGVAARVEWGVTGLWRPGGVLDRWRMRGSPVLARAQVRSDDAIALGAVVALPVAGGGGELWARVLACTGDRGTFLVTLGLLGEP